MDDSRPGGRVIDEATARGFLDLAEGVGRMGASGRERQLARLLGAADEVVVAIEYLLGADPPAALRMTAALAPFWLDAGRVDEGRRMTDRVIQAATGPATPALARSLVVAAELAFRQGDQIATEQYARRAIEAGNEAGDRGAVGLAHVNLARMAYRDGDAPRIQQHAQEALEIGGDDPAARRGALHMLAWAAHTAGDLAAAKGRFEQSAAFRRTLGDRFGVAIEMANLGDLAAEDGNLAEAAEMLAEALDVGRELDSRYLVLNLLPSLGAIAARAGDDESCARLLGATDAMSRSSGLIPDPGNWQPVVDDVAHRLGDRFDVIRAEGAELDEVAAVDLGIRVVRAVRQQ